MVEAIKQPELGSERRPARGKAQDKAQENAQDFFPNFATIREALKAGQIGIWSWDISSNAERIVAFLLAVTVIFALV